MSVLTPTPSPYPVLEEPMYSLQEAITFMRDVTILVVSQVAFYRELCPQTEMKEVDILGRKVPFLKRSSDNGVVKYLLKHLEGAFEMLDQRHLKSLSLVIKDQTRTYRLESYCLNYSYDCGSPAVSYTTSTSSNGGAHPVYYVHNSTRDLLERLQITLCSLVEKPLPSAFVIDLELFFCEDAPTDYLPEGYRFQTDEEVEQQNLFLETPLKFRSGKIKNDFTSVTFHTKFAKNLIRADSVGTEEEEDL